MERIVQKLNSPLLKRKSLTDRNRNFGVPLKCLIYKKSILVPRIVENICEFILEYGLQTEGIFRVNGSTKAIASLKAQFDITSADDLNYSDCEDIHAICGVFKLFLREIPDGLIPDVSTKQIVKVNIPYLFYYQYLKYIILTFRCFFFYIDNGPTEG